MVFPSVWRCHSAARISTSGGEQQITSADPLGAGVLMLAGSAAIGLQQKNASFTGTIVAAGGILIGSQNSLYKGSLMGQAATLAGSGNTLDGRQ